jgi:hypothetical protein
MGEAWSTPSYSGGPRLKSWPSEGFRGSPQADAGIARTKLQHDRFSSHPFQ